MMIRLRVVSATMVAFLITGVVVQSLSSEAAAQERASATPWEYRAVDFRPGHTVDEHTKQLNDLASAGWEYVGVLIPPFSHGNLAPKSTVVFRRSKRADNAGRRGALPSKKPDGCLRDQGTGMTNAAEQPDAKETQRVYALQFADARQVHEVLSREPERPAARLQMESLGRSPGYKRRSSYKDARQINLKSRSEINGY